MKNRLKQLRVSAGLTQAKIAALVGVTQPNYHRWETGSVSIPEGKLKKLAKSLKTSPEAILGRYPPVETSLYDSSVSDELSYYGEVAIHFSGGGAPLLLSISEATFSSLHRDLQYDKEFVKVKSLANQTVVIRAKAISDLYFSSEAYDDYGPEHEEYRDHIYLQMPDARDWEIVECLAYDGIGLEDFDPIDIERVRSRVMITDEQYDKLVADGLIELEELENERTKNQAKTDLIMSAAKDVTYQLSTGQRRKVYVDDRKQLFSCLMGLVEFGDSETTCNMLRLEAEGRHRIIFINKSAVDYIIIPTHQYEEGSIEETASDLDS